MCKKYDTYAIEVIHMNGNRFVKEAEDNTSYNKTMTLYRKVKEDYMSENVTIDFIGYTEDEKGSIFTKRSTTIAQEERNIEDLVLCIVEATEQLQDQFEQVSEKIGYYDKEKSNIEHLMIEGSDVDDMTEQDKVKVFNKLRKNSLLRRDYKILQSLRAITKGDISQIESLSNSLMEKYNKTIVSNSRLTEKIIQRDQRAIDRHLIKRIPYQNDKQRLNTMKQIKGKYSKVINLSDEKVLACYNNCKKWY